VLIETVGVGQAEIAVSDLVDCLVVLVAAGAGDELQGMKRGLIEHGDVFAVTKADGAERERAGRAAVDLASALELFGSDARVLTVSAQTEEGVGELLEAVERYAADAKSSGAFEERRRGQRRAWFRSAVEEGLSRRMVRNAELENELAGAVERGEISARKAATKLLGQAC
jgi:LAO/AO transport system kinase